MKPHARNQSSASFSRLCLKSKSDASSIHTNSTKYSKNTTSKYFSSVTKSNEDALKSTEKIVSNEQNPEDILQNSSNDSPYKNYITDIGSIHVNTSLNEDVDFKTPKRVSKRNVEKLKLVPKSSLRRRGRPSKAAKNQMIFVKPKPNLNNEDVNPEHLQLAIALSRSLQDNHAEDSKENEDDASSSTTNFYPNTQQRIANIKQTLQQFGFKANAKQVEVQNKRIPVKVPKKRKHSRYQYITPILLLRTQEDRIKLISEKVALALAESLPQNVISNYESQLNEPISEKLRTNWRNDSNIFKLSNVAMDASKNNDIFYTKTLNILPTASTCGNLLKDWTKIPGRAKSPVHKPTINTVDDNLTNIEPNQCTSKEIFEIDNHGESNNITEKDALEIRSFTCGGSISPELFESDDEEDIAKIPEKISSEEKKLHLNQEYSSQSLKNLTPTKNKLPHNSDEEIDKYEKICSESLLKFTPKKNNLSVSDIDVISPILTNSSFQISNTNYAKNKCTPSDFSDDDLFINDNGICTFESFSNDNTICYDLTHSFDEENNVVNDKKNLEQNVSPTLANIPPCSISNSKIMQKSLNLTEDNIFVDSKTPETTRRSKSFNITDYISNMLNEEELAVINNSKQSEVELQQKTEIEQNKVFDLTASSPNSSNSSSSFLHFTSKAASPTKHNSNSKFIKHDSFKSTTSSQGSQESIYISDEELNYSCVYSTPYIKKSGNSMPYEISDEEELTNDKNLDFTPKTSMDVDANVSQILDSPRQFPKFDNEQSAVQHPEIQKLNTSTSIVMKSRKSLFNGTNLLDDSFNMVLANSEIYNEPQMAETVPSDTSKQTKFANEILKQPQETNTTPKNEMVIKTTNITPMTNYNNMNTPKISKELEKFGIKPLKRQRGIQMLTHIYESTHPVVDQTTQNDEKSESSDENRVIKKRKSSSKIKATKKSLTPKKVKNLCIEKELVETEARMEYINTDYKNSEEKMEIIGDLTSVNETTDDLIFERKYSTKVQSCRMPLHIAWHNLLSAQPELRKNILLYEPLQLEVLYQLLKEQGYKYHIQDLLTFLDRKCITIRTNQQQHRKSLKKKKSVSPRKRK